MSDDAGRYIPPLTEKQRAAQEALEAWPNFAEVTIEIDWDEPPTANLSSDEQGLIIIGLGDFFELCRRGAALAEAIEDDE